MSSSQKTVPSRLITAQLYRLPSPPIYGLSLNSLSLEFYSKYTRVGFSCRQNKIKTVDVACVALESVIDFRAIDRLHSVGNNYYVNVVEAGIQNGLV